MKPINYTREEGAAKIKAATDRLMEVMAVTAAAIAAFNDEVAHVAKHSDHLTADEREQIAAARETMAKTERAIRGMVE